jgi:hypothetical protein
MWLDFSKIYGVRKKILDSRTKNFFAKTNVKKFG